MARRRVPAVLASLLVALLLTACSTAVPDPRPNTAEPAAPPTAAVRLAEPSLEPVGGRVRTAAGAPAVHAVVTLRQVGVPTCGRCGRLTEAVTGEDGTFALAVPRGTYALACSTVDARPCWLRQAADLRQGALTVTGPVGGLRFVAPSG